MKWYTKFIYKTARHLLSAGAWLWAAETAYFLIKYGWHLRAINEAEKICDNIASMMMLSGIAMYVVVFLLFIDEMFDDV